MIKGNYNYGISMLPTNCIAYRDGYRYGAYKQNIENRDDMHITKWFKNKEEIQAFVNENREYRKEGK